MGLGPEIPGDGGFEALHSGAARIGSTSPTTSSIANISQLRDLGQLEGRAVATGNHCFGCTAGAGSSCGGALVEA